MARKPKRTKEVDNVRDYVEGVAKNLVDKLYGPRGPAWGTKLTELEDICLDIREVLTEKLLALALERQAAGHGQEPAAQFRVCPGCQRPIDWEQGMHERSVQTRTGEVAWSEPEGYCPRCRRAFFPSESSVGH